MPIYKLKIGGTDSGMLQVTNANNQTTWSYKPQGGSGFSTLSPAPTCSATNPVTPQPGDTLNIAACTTITSSPPSANATYANATDSKKAGYYYSGGASITASAPGSWDAEDSGSK